MMRFLLALFGLLVMGACVPVPMDFEEAENVPAISSLSPLTPYITLTPNSSSQSFAVTVSDVEDSGYVIQWRVDGTLEASGTSSYSFDPSGREEGYYTVSVTVLDTSGLVLYDTENWIIEIDPVEYIEASPEDGVSIEVMDGYEVSMSGKWLLANGDDVDPEINLLANLSSSINWIVRFYDEDGLIGSVATGGTMRTVALSDADPNYKIDLAIPSISETSHYIEAKVFYPTLIQIGETIHWDLEVVPVELDISVSSVNPTQGTTIDVLNGSAISVAGAWTQSSVAVTPSVAVNTPKGSDGISGVTYEFYDNYGGTENFLGSTTSTVAGSIALAVVVPTLTYTLADPNTSESYELTARMVDTYSGVQIGSDVTWDLNIIPSTSVGNIISVYPAANSSITVIDEIDVSTSGGWVQVADAAPGVMVDDDSQGPVIYFYHFDGTSRSLITATGTDTMTANVMHYLSDVAPAFAINIADDTYETHYIEAEVIDGNGNQLGATQRWNISVRPQNTTPTIAVDTVNGQDNASTVTGLIEMTGEDFAITASDDDSSAGDLTVTWQLDGEDLDGTVGLAGSLWEGISKPSCNGASNTASTCSLLIPNYNDNGPLVPSTHTLTATVTDIVTNGAAAKTSSTITWNLATPTEYQSSITLNGGTVAFVGAGAAVYDTDVTTFIYDPSVSLTTAINSADEGDTIGFNVAVYDADRDNYELTIQYSLDNVTFYDIPGATTYPVSITRTDGEAANSGNSYSLQIPEEWSDAASYTLYFRFYVEDVPNSGIAATWEEQFTSITVNENNPIPTFTPGTYAPTLASTLNVMAGMPLTIDPGGTFANPPWSDTSDLLYQWQINTDSAGWTDITGATNDTLTWIPPIGLNSSTSIFRLCVGDDNFGGADDNPADCSGLTVGPWVGSGSNFVTIRDADKQFIGAQTYSEMASLYDATNGVLYTALSSGNNIVVSGATVSSGYTLSTLGTYTAPVYEFDDTTASTAYNISLDVEETSGALVVAYAFDDGTLLNPQVLSGARVLRFDAFSGAAPDQTYVINDINNGIGDIVMEDSTNLYWYLPLVGALAGNQIMMINAAYDDATGSYSAYTITGSYSAGGVHSTLTNNDIIMALENASGNWDLVAYDLSALGSATYLSSTTDLFSIASGNIEDVDLSVGNKLFVAASDTLSPTSVEVLRFDDPVDYSSGADVSGTVTHNSRNISEMHIAAGADATAADQVSIFYSESVGPGIYFSNVDTSSAGANMETSFDNESVQAASIGGTAFYVTEMLSDATIGDDGATSNENVRDVVFVFYEDGTNTNVLFLNTQEETTDISATDLVNGFFTGFLNP